MFFLELILPGNVVSVVMRAEDSLEFFASSSDELIVLGSIEEGINEEAVIT